jgi:hypothetical protein
MSRLKHEANRLRHFVAGVTDRTPRWSLHREMFRQATLIVWFYYAATAYFLYEGARELSDITLPLESFDLLWPVAWLAQTGIHTGGKLIAQIGLAAGLLGLLWWRVLAVRVLVSIALLFYAAYANSDGVINHGHHEWFWISVCFWLLPNGRPERVSASRVDRMSFLAAFSLAPLLVLFCYTLSGVYKCYYALVALLSGNVGGFAPDAMAITVAWRAIQTGSQPIWATPLLDFPLIGWPFYLALYFVELVSIIVFFRPSLHRIWGLVLIAFHVGTLLFMDITFPRHVLINGMLFVMSPFALGAHSWRTQLLCVPVLGFLARPFLKPKVAPPQNAEGGVAAEA